MKFYRGHRPSISWTEGHWGIVNMWRPLDLPVQRTPLAFIDPNSVKPGNNSGNSGISPSVNPPKQSFVLLILSAYGIRSSNAIIGIVHAPTTPLIVEDRLVKKLNLPGRTGKITGFLKRDYYR